MRWRRLLAVVALTWIANIAHFIHKTRTSPLVALQWFVAQSIPWPYLSKSLQVNAWHRGNRNVTDDGDILDCPVLDLSVDTGDIREMAEAKYGKDWRDRPLLLKGLWSASDLVRKERRLSLSGLLQENLTIPYFVDASAPYALSPDSSAPTSEIIANMTKGHPHKIGTQWIVQTFPELIQEVAPTALVTPLFGNYFRPENVQGSGPFRLFPALTTVPVFVARTGATNKAECTTDLNCEPAHPRTDLHCEPIGNLAVQLQGEKKWSLVSPVHTFRLDPAVAPDGRAFFASFSSSIKHIPRYQVAQKAGDALWVPPWTWHRVDYVGDTHEIAIGGSLFHFRLGDFLRNNPLFALLIIPNLIKEVIGGNSQ
jgi:hypothetical protein